MDGAVDVLSSEPVGAEESGDAALEGGWRGAEVVTGGDDVVGVEGHEMGQGGLGDRGRISEGAEV